MRREQAGKEGRPVITQLSKNLSKIFRATVQRLKSLFMRYFILWWFMIFPSDLSKAYGRRIKLLLMPQGMSRRNENESFLHPSTSTIFWKIAVTFVISENSTFEEILNAEMSSTQSSNVLSFNMLKVDENAVLRDFIAASLEQTEVTIPKTSLVV